MGKENPVSRFHSFAGGAMQCSIDFQAAVAGQLHLLFADKGRQLPPAAKALYKQFLVIDHTVGSRLLKAPVQSCVIPPGLPTRYLLSGPVKRI